MLYKLTAHLLKENVDDKTIMDLLGSWSKGSLPTYSLTCEHSLGENQGRETDVLWIGDIAGADPQLSVQVPSAFKNWWNHLVCNLAAWGQTLAWCTKHLYNSHLNGWPPFLEDLPQGIH